MLIPAGQKASATWAKDPAGCIYSIERRTMYIEYVDEIMISNEPFPTINSTCICLGLFAHQSSAIVLKSITLGLNGSHPMCSWCVALCIPDWTACAMLHAARCRRNEACRVPLLRLANWWGVQITTRGAVFRAVGCLAGIARVA